MTTKPARESIQFDNSSTPLLNADSTTAKANSLSVLLSLWQFMRPYSKTLLCAGLALVFTAAITLSIGQGVRLLIDDGFVAQSSDALANAVVMIIGLAFLMALGTYTLDSEVFIC